MLLIPRVVDNDSFDALKWLSDKAHFDGQCRGIFLEKQRSSGDHFRAPHIPETKAGFLGFVGGVALVLWSSRPRRQTLLATKPINPGQMGHYLRPLVLDTSSGYLSTKRSV